MKMIKHCVRKVKEKKNKTQKNKYLSEKGQRNT